MKKLLDYIDDRRDMSKDEFVSAYPDPVLLHRIDDDEEEGSRAFRTGLTDPHATRMELAVGLSTDPELGVVTVVKRSGGVFNDRIGVGRTRNNDIILPFPKVSKFHAYFTWAADRSEFYLTDAGSTNGTSINGHKLAPKEAVVTPDRCVVSFGRYHFRFHMAEGMFEVLGQIAFGE